MALKRFKTEWHLWAWISLVLFLVPWFVPMLSAKGGPNVAPGALWLGLFAAPSQIGEDGLRFIGILTLMFGIPAISIGWIVQGIVVMIRDRRRHQ